MSRPWKKPPKEGMDLKQCVARADYHIKREGICLLVFDIVDSRNHYDRIIGAYHMAQHLNKVFAHAMPRNSIRTYAADDTGFVCIQGDKAVGGISSVDAVEQIIKYQTFVYPEIPLRWVVAKDGWDPDVKRI